MTIRFSDPRIADDLLEALGAADCIAERVADDTVEVEIPWVERADDRRQAEVELVFFVRAWEAQHPGLATLVCA